MRWWVCALLAALAACAKKKQVTEPTLRIVAHRGASLEAPENTLRAVRLAWQQGAHAVEIDVRVSRDDVPILFHDEDTERLCGVKASVDTLTYDELKACRVLGREPIPTLKEVVETVPPEGVLVVEIKSPVSTVPTVIAALPEDGRFVFQSFQEQVLLAVKRRRPGARLYWTIGPEKDGQGKILPLKLNTFALAKERGFHGVAVHHRAVTQEVMDARRIMGGELDVWTVNDPGRVKELARLGVDWIETDLPAMAKRALSTQP